MKVDYNGKYFTLPVTGRPATDIVVEGLPKFCFIDEGYEAKLEIHGSFRVVYNQEEVQYNNYSDEVAVILSTFYGVIIEDARANKQGVLFIRFEDQRELIVDDGPYENWHFYIYKKHKSTCSTHLGGGVGQTFLFG